MKSLSRVVACPGIPVVFAEGYRIVDGRRFSCHASVGAALTDEKSRIRTETKVEPSDAGTSLLVDGKPIIGERGEGMVRIIEEFKRKADYAGGVSAESANHDITSGSSDSGAAALTVALNDFFELGLSKSELFELGLYGSETVFRSLYGGLTEYIVSEKGVSAGELAAPEELSDVVVYAVSFPGQRFSSDEIHAAVVSHPTYRLREKQVEDRILHVKKSLIEKDLLGVFAVMEEDARRVHRMFADVGMKVLTDEMRAFCDAVRSWRREGVEAYWNVAGGNWVYVFCLKKQANEVGEKIRDGGRQAHALRIAGGAKVI